MTENSKKKAFNSPIDRRDIVGIGGLCLIGTGLWWIFPPAALIVPGLILTGIAVFGVRG